MTRIPDPLPPPGEGFTSASAVQWLACGLLCIGVGAATAAFVRSTVRSARPPPAIAQFTDKLAFWRAHEAEFDVLIFGTSSVYRGIDPLVFDAETARRGYATRTFNASLPGLKFADEAAFLREYVDAAGASLRWVLVEPNIRVFLKFENVDRERVTRVHDLPNTLDLLRLVAASPFDFGDKLGFAANHVLAATYRAAGAGEIARLIRPAMPPRADPDLARHHGFVSIEATYPDEMRIRDLAFSKLLAGLRDGTIPADFVNDDSSLLPAVATERFLEIADGVSRRARIAWIVMPYFGRSIAQRFRNSYAAGDIPGVLLDLEDPVGSPRARNPRFFSDRTHLNSLGARRTSKHLANRFVSNALEAP